MKAYVINDGWAGGLVILASSPEEAVKHVQDRRRALWQEDGKPYSDEEMVRRLKENESEIFEGWNYDFAGDQ